MSPKLTYYQKVKEKPVTANAFDPKDILYLLWKQFILNNQTYLYAFQFQWRDYCTSFSISNFLIAFLEAYGFDRPLKQSLEGNLKQSTVTQNHCFHVLTLTGLVFSLVQTQVKVFIHTHHLLILPNWCYVLEASVASDWLFCTETIPLCTNCIWYFVPLNCVCVKCFCFPLWQLVNNWI